MSRVHLQEELARSNAKVTAETRHGPIHGRRAANGAAVFLEVPYALPPIRFQDAVPLPASYRYEEKEYILESKYAVQPKNDGQAAGIPVEDKLGLGQPSEDPLFVNIVSPPSFPAQGKLPVKVYIHGGFLQFGSPHGLSGQAQFVSTERSEVWVNIGYRLSAFGFLASDEPKIDGNFGFKDQWLALLWIRDNIQAFGGDPENVQITGLSAGAHSVHQLLHHASRLPDGEKAPFRSAILQSNAIVSTPKTPAELRPQFEALCRALFLDPAAPDILETLRDTHRVPWSAITHAIDTDSLGTIYGTFRGCWEPSWLGDTDPMTWQRSGGFAKGLAAHGVRAVVVGDLTEEWYIYSLSHPVSSISDIVVNLERYYNEDVVHKMMEIYGRTPTDPEEVKKAFGQLLAEAQVHLPVRLLARDLINAEFPVVRYEIAWTPEQVRPFGYVTHGTDRPLWTIRLNVLEGDQVAIARNWVDTIAEYIKRAEEGHGLQGVKKVLGLTENKEIKEKEDTRWDDYMSLRKAFPGEEPVS
ncbi:carboxylesterase [Trametes punicea]|nr:carboxylesterase [Trametes punicea]